MRRRSRSCCSSSCSSSPSSICASRAGSRASREPAPGRCGRARPAGPRGVDGRHALNVVRARAVPVGVPHVAQDARRPLRHAAPLPARGADRGQLRGRVDVQAHALQPVLRQQPVGILGDHGGHDRRLDPGRLRPRPLSLRRPERAPAGLPRDADVPGGAPHRALLSQWYALGLIDTYQALIYSNLSFTVPFTVWMLVGYFDAIPRDLEESALIDGCGRFGALCRIVLPLAAPGIAATAIFAFVTSWSELLFAITFTTQTEMRTLSAGLLFMVGQYEIQWGQLSAGVMISTVPVAVLFTYLQRHLIRGLSAGALKG